MMDDVVMRAEGVSKKFARRIRHNMFYGTIDVGRGMLGMEARTDVLRPGEFWAVEDASIELRAGETIGLIGQNGSGKSTLLRLMNGIYQPDKGRIEIRGRVGALIAVGAGFHPLMTGRENIYLNGSILGMTKAEIDRKFDSIVEFADIGDFLDAPVKTYSSGMHVRLGFAIAIHCDPDILLVDEVLAVGDFNFRQKCFHRISQMRKNASVVLVSHNMRDITLFCDKAAVIDRGRVIFCGAPQEAAGIYMDTVESRKPPEKAAGGVAPSKPPGIYGPTCHNTERIADVSHRWNDSAGAALAGVEHGSRVSLDFSFRLLAPARSIVIGVAVWDREGQLVTGIGTDMSGVSVEEAADGTVSGSLVLDKVILNPGTYASSFAVVDGNEFLYRDFNNDFSVRMKPVSFGVVTHDHRWELDGKPPR